MLRRYRLPLYLILVISFHLLIEIFVLSTVSRITLTGNISNTGNRSLTENIGDTGNRSLTENIGDTGNIQIYYTTQTNAPPDIHQGFSEQRLLYLGNTIKKPEHDNYIFYANNRPVHKLRLDINAEKGEFELKNITLHSFFSDTIKWSANDFKKHIAATNNMQIIGSDNNSIRLSITGEDPWMVIDKPIEFNNQFLSYILPFLLAFITLIVISQVNWRHIPAIADVRHKTSSANLSYHALDGIRGLAALLVIFEHTVGYGKAIGFFGILLFFCLSGFLLSIPFIRQPEKILSADYIAHYFTRRILRIIPLYYFVIFILFMMKGDFGIAVRHILFLQADGYLWTIPQEMLFYLFLPIVLLINFQLIKIFGIYSALISLFIFAIGFDNINDWLNIRLYGLGTHLTFFGGVFLLGCLTSYFYHGVYLRSEKMIKTLHKFQVPLGIIALLVLCVCIYLSTFLLHNSPALGIYIVKLYYIYFAFAACLLILLALIANKSMYAKALSLFPLCAAGITGYSIYLLHPSVIGILKSTTSTYFNFTLEEIPLFISATIATYILSLFTYSCIEKPFMKKS